MRCSKCRMEASATGPSGERLCDRHYNPTMAAAPGMVGTGTAADAVGGFIVAEGVATHVHGKHAPSAQRGPGLLGRLKDALERLVADSPPSDRPPGSNYLPNSNGEGGRVISSGDGNSS
jgi:hypothetical protein